ncbi:hypothetical protein QA597_09520 [Marinilabiliaceae bacterium ANBcel2]|nr:hypothetical protein [Marinilabiliaceae bacterium ANBcel2]
MARQESFIKLKGRIGDLTFYKSGGEYLARTKGGIDGDRIRTDPRFERTRENGREFLRAVKSGKLLRDAFSEHIFLTADRGMNGRLTAVFSKVVKSDHESARGERMVMLGNIALVSGFEFNGGANLESIFFGRYEAGIAEGIASVALQPFNPALNIRRPEGATHGQLIMVGGNFNFDTLTSSVVNADSDPFVLTVIRTFVSSIFRN